MTVHLHLNQLLIPLAFVAGLVAPCIAKRSSCQAFGPENTVVVVNENSPASLEVANRYIELRRIPPTNVVYLNKIPSSNNLDTESSNSRFMISHIIEPLKDAIKSRGLEEQIDCIAYSSDFPTRISIQPSLKQYLEHTGKKYDIHFHAPWGSLTSLTYFQEDLMSDRPTFLELDANAYADLRRNGFLENPLSGVSGFRFDQAIEDVEIEDFESATEILLELAKENPNQVGIIYWLARALAGAGKNDDAIRALVAARLKGLSRRSFVEKDEAFERLRSLAGFQTLLRGMEDLPEPLLPTRGFSSQYHWSQNGWPNGPNQSGDRYVLSTIIAVTGEKRSTVQQALKQIESSVAADYSQPSGNVYFAKHGDPRSQTRKSQFPFARAELNSIGGKGTITEQATPKNDARIMGVTLGSPVIDWSASKSRFLPGAICDNFTSYGGWWAKAGQTQLSDHLNHGAAGACGTVYEPYTIPAKIPNARIHAHYRRGCTLAEAFYQSVSGPFQLLMVGDPLCRPYGTPPKFGIERRESSTEDGEFSIELSVSEDSLPIRHFQFYLDGVFVRTIPATTTSIRVRKGQISAGYHEIRVVAIQLSDLGASLSKSLNFTIDGEANVPAISTANAQVNSTDQIVLSISDAAEDLVEIRQNSRVLSTLQGNGKVTIKASALGKGTSHLQALVIKENGKSHASAPLEIHVK